MRYFLVILVLVCGLMGGIPYANAQQELLWTYFLQNSSPAPTLTVTPATDHYRFQFTGITTTGPGFKIGSPYLTNGKYPYNQTPWVVDYEVLSSSASGTCAMRPYSSTTAVPGSLVTNLVTGARTTASLSFTNAFINAGEIGLLFFRNTGTCDLDIKIFSIKDAFGGTLWSPAIQDSATIDFPTDIQFQSDTIVWSMGFMIFLMAINTWYIIIRKR